MPVSADDDRFHASLTVTRRDREIEDASTVAAHAQPAGVRALKRRRIRSELVKAGLSLFGENGFEVTTVEDIVGAVGVSRRTFFRYFKSKDDVVFEWMQELGEQLLGRLRLRRADETALQAITRAFLGLADYHDAHSRRARFVTRLIFQTPSLSSRYHDEYAKWEERFIRALLPVRRPRAEAAFAIQVQVAVAIAAFVVAVRTWSRDRARGRLRDVVASAFAVLDSQTRD